MSLSLPRPVSLLLLLLVAAAALSSSRGGGVVSAQYVSSGSIFGSSNNLGSAVAVSGALVAAYHGGGSGGGGINVYSCPTSASCVLGTTLHTGQTTAPSRNSMAAGYLGASATTVLAVGFPNEGAGAGANQGVVAVFACTSASSCASSQNITAPSAAAGDYFGAAVAIGVSGTVNLVVGAYGRTNGDGVVYLYACTTASTCQNYGALRSSYGTGEGTQFGISVAASGYNVLVGGAGGNTNTGAYLFDCTTPSACQSATIFPNVPRPSASTGNDGFGTYVAVANQGATLVLYVGAAGSSNYGIAYVFKYAGGTFTLTGNFTQMVASAGNAGTPPMLHAAGSILLHSNNQFSNGGANGRIYVANCPLNIADGSITCQLVTTLAGGSRDVAAYATSVAIDLQQSLIVSGAPYDDTTNTGPFDGSIFVYGPAATPTPTPTPTSISTPSATPTVTSAPPSGATGTPTAQPTATPTHSAAAAVAFSPSIAILAIFAAIAAAVVVVV